MPMTDAELKQYFARLELAPSTRRYIELARNSPPARRVRSRHKRNAIWRFASRKMGLTIAGESSLEKNYHVLIEFDPEVIEFWDQPPTIPLQATDRNGQLRRVPYTPDVLILRRNGPLLVQIKSTDDCRKLASENPGRWSHDRGEPEDSAASEFAKEMGLQHRVVTENQINPILANNLLAIERSASLPRDREYRRSATRLMDLLDQRGAITARKAMAELQVQDSTCILQMIADSIICASLTDTDVGCLERLWLGIDIESIEDVRKAFSVANDAQRSKPTAVATGNEAKALLHRLAALSEPGLSSGRSIRRWRRLLRDAKGDVFSLIPRTKCRGNRNRRITEADAQLITMVIETYYKSALATTPAAAYRRYLKLHRHLVRRGKIPSGGIPVSEPTFRAAIKRSMTEALAAGRGGQRAANAAASPVPPSKREPRASRPFQRAHIDHYKADLHTVVNECARKRITRRLWISAIRDEWSGAVLGIAVRLRCPSRIACSLVLRDCVRRHQRLPETIVVDNGKEFDSTYFEVLLARYGVTKQSRPPGAPRFGSTIESLFKAVREFLMTLPGSTRNDERGRAVSAGYRGQAQAALDTEATYDLIERFCFEGFNKSPIGGRTESPEHILQQGLLNSSYSGVACAIDQEFLALSALPIERRPKVDPTRGVRHLGRWFFCSELMRRASKRVEILEEPWDENMIYAVIDGEAFPCFHGHNRGAWDYSTTAMLRAMLVSEGAEIREQAANDRRINYEAIVERARKLASPRQALTKSGSSTYEGLPPSKEGLKPFAVKNRERG